MINITFYFYRFLDSLRSLEMTVLHLAWISRLASLARNDKGSGSNDRGSGSNDSKDNSLGDKRPVISTVVEKSNTQILRILNG